MIFIGIAGWSLDAKAKPLFGEGASHLARYATRFAAVEINSAFYRPHRTATYARWAASVPQHFRFAVKLPRAIAHLARLKTCETLLDEFQGQVAGLGDKLGPILIQLPPSLNFEASIAETFLRAMRARFAGGLVLEPRHRSWSAPEATSLLRQFRVVRVEADPAPVPNAVAHEEFRYLRWHGSPVMYRSSYDDAALKALARKLEDGDWCIFDNTAEGAAIRNGLALRELL
jgi:uncharacterized protein YecE (DUF72 family)